MKSKALIAVAVASTFGWSAASFAGSSHSVITPFSPNESGEVLTQLQGPQGFGSDSMGVSSATGGISDSGSGTLSGSSDSMSSSSFSGARDESASVAMGDSFAAADEGIYSDYHVIGWTPATVETWNYYIIDDGGTPELVAIGETTDVLMPTHELALVPSASDEMVYELTLVPLTFGEMREGAAD